MKFTIINNEQGHMSLKGYRIVSDAERFWNKEIYNQLANDISVNYADALFDDLYDGFEPICKGEDGKLYTVLFQHINNEFKPFIWQEVKEINEERE